MEQDAQTNEPTNEPLATRVSSHDPEEAPSVPTGSSLSASSPSSVDSPAPTDFPPPADSPASTDSPSSTSSPVSTGSPVPPVRNRRIRARLIIALIVVILLVAASTGAVMYVSDYYHADAIAQEAQADAGSYAIDGITVKTVDNMTAFIPENPIAGLVFYPGGKVEAQAYAPLMQALAAHRILGVVCAMPLNLAVFDIDAAQRVQTAFLLDFPEVDAWYIGGHSLGGSMAADFVSKHADDYTGLILLGSYATVDLSKLDLRVLCIYGANDGVMNRAAYEQNFANLPAGSEEVVLEGGNHGQFGSYGYQAGDGEATITPQEQWDQTAEIIAEWVLQ